MTIDSTFWWAKPLVYRVLGITPNPTQRLGTWNLRLQRIALEFKPDIFIVFKGLWVTGDTVASIGARTIHYHPDDSANEDNRSESYSRAEPLYDLHVTTKSFNVDELEARGAKAVLYLPCAFDRDWHRSAGSWISPRTIGFIGNRRPDRVRLIKSLADKFRKDLHVSGTKWMRDPFLSSRATVSGPKYGFDLSMQVARAPIQLGLLNSENRDLHTCRSYEVPAAGGLLIGERTREHSAILEEGAEALFFSDVDELHEILDRCRGDGAYAARIAQAGQHRIVSTRNSYDDRWRSIVQTFSGAGSFLA